MFAPGAMYSPLSEVFMQPMNVLTLVSSLKRRGGHASAVVVDKRYAESTCRDTYATVAEKEKPLHFDIPPLQNSGSPYTPQLMVDVISGVPVSE